MTDIEKPWAFPDDERPLLRWDVVTYSPDARVLDVPIVGRYLVRRAAKGSSDFNVTLNGVYVTRGNSMAGAVTIVENIIKQTVPLCRFQRVQ